MSLLNQSLLCLFLLVPQIEGFQTRILRICHHHISTSARAFTLLQAEGNKKEQDLFDYFDPLLSPHAYPNGIEAGPTTNSEESSSRNVVPPQVSTTSSPPPPLEAVPPQAEVDRQDQDLFDYFDPLLSPHAYPNGIEAGPITTSKKSPPVSSPPPPLETVPPELRSGKKRKVGVLLMDHGSRNSASNARLEKMAELYQLTSNYDRTDDDDTIVVEAAHMEIASPSIAEGLKKLLDQGVDEIICHPYFLSPGRHVTEDIPELLEQAKNELKIDNIRMVCTKPIGANTQLMIGAIHALVQENSSILQSQGQQ
ncbi:unnamed protein product [Cylindrotheca closterium]|uniref:Sirohydrochlorin cobaltochelatase n=1 Tax=Cylindrotheca closterium TaxID=2856 RepID=A0AAD2CML8_9STRA|nr:unnamed protein product [Cylindrotheca closterium]